MSVVLKLALSVTESMNTNGVYCMGERKRGRTVLNLNSKESRFFFFLEVHFSFIFFTFFQLNERKSVFLMFIFFFHPNIYI